MVTSKPREHAYQKYYHQAIVLSRFKGSAFKGSKVLFIVGLV
jgi:hypothetical protein